MTPLMYSSAPGVVNSMSRYACRFASVDSRPIVSKRFLIVPPLSSAARIPLPSATSALAVCRSSLLMGEPPLGRSSVLPSCDLPQPLEPVPRLDAPDGSGQRAHRDRIRHSLVADVPDAAQQIAGRDAGGGDEHVLARHEIVGR